VHVLCVCARVGIPDVIVCMHIITRTCARKAQILAPRVSISERCPVSCVLESVWAPKRTFLLPCIIHVNNIVRSVAHTLQNT
jgi:hypothetical protein